MQPLQQAAGQEEGLGAALPCEPEPAAGAQDRTLLRWPGSSFTAVFPTRCVTDFEPLVQSNANTGGCAVQEQEARRPCRAFASTVATASLRTTPAA